MSRNRRNSGGGAFITVVFIVAVFMLGVLVVLYTNNPIKRKLVSMAVNKMLDEKIENMEETLDSDVSTEETSNNHISEEKDSNEVSSAERKANEVLKSMSEEDRETVTDIITENMTPSTINEVSEYIESKDKEGLMNYAKENLSDEDYEKLQELYKKYSENGQIDSAAIEQE